MCIYCNTINSLYYNIRLILVGISLDSNVQKMKEMSIMSINYHVIRALF